jgi:conjugative transposon TraN protein
MLYFINSLSLRILLLSMLALTAVQAVSQPILNSQNVELTCNKTSSIVFAANITSVDRGSRDVLAQKAKGVNNVLQLKASKTNFKETNLTVITADGKLHHFMVRYADQPAALTLKADTTGAVTQHTLHFVSEMTELAMEVYSQKIISLKEKKNRKTTSQFDMRLSLKGIFIQDNIMFYHLNISNKSNIAYHPEIIRFYIKDKKKAKRTASQQVDEHPIYRYGNTQVIKGQSSVDIIYALPKFTIPDAKVLTMEVMEKRGGRHLKLSIKNKLIIRAATIAY